MLSFFLFGLFVVQIPESDASILSISIDREASYMAAVNNQVIKNGVNALSTNIITMTPTVACKINRSILEGTGLVIWRFWVQALHPATSWICFTVVPSSNPRSRFVCSQLICLLPVGIFNHVMFI